MLGVNETWRTRKKTLVGWLAMCTIPVPLVIVDAFLLYGEIMLLCGSLVPIFVYVPHRHASEATSRKGVDRARHRVIPARSW